MNDGRAGVFPSRTGFLGPARSRSHRCRRGKTRLIGHSLSAASMYAWWSRPIGRTCCPSGVMPGAPVWESSVDVLVTPSGTPDRYDLPYGPPWPLGQCNRAICTLWVCDPPGRRLRISAANCPHSRRGNRETYERRLPAGQRRRVGPSGIVVRPGARARRPGGSAIGSLPGGSVWRQRKARG